MKIYKNLIFDLDGTLAESKSPLSSDMSIIFSKASHELKLAIITGGMFDQIQQQVIDRLDDNAQLQNIYILPTSGSEMRLYNTIEQSWDIVYSHKIQAEQKERVINSLERALDQSSVIITDSEIAGDQIEDRDSQITFSALGQKQKPEIKSAWDSDESKRREIMKYLTHLNEEFDVKLGGTTSIDITLKGIDKEYGINEFFKQTGFDIKESLFIGDKIIPGGNDWAATKTGIDTYNTSGPKETAQIIQQQLEAR